MARDEHEVLPGELSTFRAVGAFGFILGAFGGASIWVSEPEVIHSTAIGWITTLACVVTAAVMATVPWQRVHPAWLLTPATVAAVVIAAAIHNMDGGREVYDGFYLYVALSVGYFLPGRYVRMIVVVIALASAVPLITDAGIQSIVRWAFVAAGNGMVVVVVRTARVRVRAYAAEVRTLALQDQLTGVLNRRGFEERAGGEISRARRNDAGFALVYLDLDGFKRVNDNLSHAAGDRVLHRAALAMAAELRGEDVLARMGGDEFVVLLDGAGDADAEPVAARLVAAIEGVAAAEPGAGHVSATTGWSVFPTDGETLDALLTAADARMLERKRARPVAR